MKYLFFIISIHVYSTIWSMEHNTEPTEFLKKSQASIKFVNEGLAKLEVMHQARLKHLEENLLNLKKEKNNKLIEQSFKSVGNFNRSNVLIMLGLTSISFFVGYMIGSKSLSFHHLVWTKYKV